MNYYELLDVDPKAENEEIKRAYHEKLKVWHPDTNFERKEEAEEMTKALNIAYGILSDPSQRKNYDRILRYSKGRSYRQDINDSSFSKTIEKASWSLRGIMDDVKELYNLFRDAISGKYKIHPVNLGIIGGGLLYFIIPTDLIPDFLPMMGFLDDAAVLTTIINALRVEIAKYREWKK